MTGNVCLLQGNYREKDPGNLSSGSYGVELHLLSLTCWTPWIWPFVWLDLTSKVSCPDIGFVSDYFLCSIRWLRHLALVTIGNYHSYPPWLLQSLDHLRWGLVSCWGLIIWYFWFWCLSALGIQVPASHIKCPWTVTAKGDERCGQQSSTETWPKASTGRSLEQHFVGEI